MAKNFVNILFWLYKSKATKTGLIPIYLRITINSQRKNLSTGFIINEDRWDANKGLVKGFKDDARQINQYILNTKTKIRQIFKEMTQEGEINLEVLVDRFHGTATVSSTLLQAISEHNENFESRIDIDFAESTFEKYKILYKKVKNFISYKYDKKDIQLKELSNAFIADFDFYLKRHDKNGHNTTTKYLKNLKKVMNHAVMNKLIESNPFKDYKSSYKDVNRVYLTQHELDIIAEKKIVLNRLSLVRDLFIFQCYTGLSYTDMTRLTIENVSIGIDGFKWIITRRKKTDARSAFPILEAADKILIKYTSDLIEKPNDQLFPAFSIQKFNSYLHEIAEICGINKNLTSHVGRRTFATTVALSNGISIETISKILGHTSTKITAQYAVVTDLKISKEMIELRQKLSRGNANPIVNKNIDNK